MKNKESKPRVYYPIFLNIRGKKCVVIGGGNVALRKVKMLLDCGANVAVISPRLHQDLERLVEEGAIRWIERKYDPRDLKNMMIAIAATNVQEINERVAQDAKKRKILVNVADDLEQSDYIIPSFFRRGDLTIAISTGGGSPALARKIRTKLEQIFGEEYGLLLSLIEEVRSEIKLQGIGVSPEAWQKALDLDLLIDLLKADQREKAKGVLLGNLEIRQILHDVKLNI